MILKVIIIPKKSTDRHNDRPPPLYFHEEQFWSFSIQRLHVILQCRWNNHTYNIESGFLTSIRKKIIVSTMWFSDCLLLVGCLWFGWETGPAAYEWLLVMNLYDHLYCLWNYKIVVFTAMCFRLRLIMLCTYSKSCYL